MCFDFESVRIFKNIWKMKKAARIFQHEQPFEQAAAHGAVYSYGRNSLTSTSSAVCALGPRGVSEGTFTGFSLRENSSSIASLTARAIVLKRSFSSVVAPAILILMAMTLRNTSPTVDMIYFPVCPAHL